MKEYFIALRMENGTVKYIESYFTFEEAKKAMMIHQNALYQSGRYQMADSLFIKEKEN